MREIPLTRNLVAIVDDEDFEELSAHKWMALQVRRRGGIGYACRGVAVEKWKRTSIYMHRQIMKATKGVLVDHINHNTLDNRKCNLRLATSSDNAANTRRAIGKSGYRGVRIDTRDNAFLVQVRGDSARFKSAEEAARAYDALALKHFGEFAKLNFPGIST